MNQASVKSFAVPVFPAMLSFSFAAEAAVPRCVTPRRICRSWNADCGFSTSRGSGCVCSRTSPLESVMRSIRYGEKASPWLAKTE
jgi:hypothetical protein